MLVQQQSSRDVIGKEARSVTDLPEKHSRHVFPLVL
jgi:hypothetical protein